MRTHPRNDLLRTWAVLVPVLLLAGQILSACARQRSDVPVHHWWTERGPVIPHGDFPADCTLCHAGDDWHTLRPDFTFDHEARTGVALEGAHRRAECLRCHNDRGPVALFSARGCGGCHGDVHQGELGSECAECHGQTDWRPRGAIERHARTRFPLLGSHAAAACWRCHPGADAGDFAPLDTDCVSCHRDDLARARNPDHRFQGWVDACHRCHVPTSWRDADFDHDFPIDRGEHGGLSCVQCHVVPGDFSQFSCVDCHAHGMREMDDEHDDVRGYVYSSPACYSCHPDGEED